MIVVVIVSLLVVIGLAVALWRAQAASEELTARVDELSAELDDADNEITAALAEATRATKERDDAFERVQRARRDAAEVAGRLQEERSARETAERAAEIAEARAATAEDVLRERTEELDAQRVALADMEQAGGAAAGPDVDRLWALALAASERTWRTSVAAGPVAASPLVDSDDPLRAAIEIEVDAAREEAGAAIDLVWELEGVAPVAQAVVALATVQELVACIAKTAASATLTVSGVADGVEVTIAAADDDGAPLEVAIAGPGAVAPGRYRVGSA